MRLPTTAITGSSELLPRGTMVRDEGRAGGGVAAGERPGAGVRGALDGFPYG
ncbi:hypothetical protein GCM10009549_35100 [Streptomyces thermoalcalitolerans]|uniref:Uncharacterized protein n=1 Tax=Streptomyces thermoalcalitolerans TaxID=65605 RepID=A0ABN1NWR3_9ACTN